MSGSRFNDVELILVHGSFPYNPQPADPAISRMDSVHRCAVAFLFRSYGTRADAVMHVLFSDGALRLTGKIRQDFPKGRGAAWAGPFLTAVRKQGAGASFARYRPGESMASTLQRLVRPGSVCLALDSEGTQMQTRAAPSEECLGRCPTSVTFVVGGPRGYQPSNFAAVSGYLRDAAGRNFCALSLPGPQQFASSVISYLQISNETNALRPAVAQTFYQRPQEGARTERVKFEWVARRSDIYTCVRKMKGAQLLF